jgi:hypothetical protein
MCFVIGGHLLQVVLAGKEAALLTGIADPAA